ncbi:protein FAR1-RELATED SEQUENCE 5-like [Morus notabilis]|uniref:protein FAR1-RELATED SEQUENCE 5-like n=1 Tax=Morus notabilis TaxID=981085 RepID=UPI000CED233C|nr:protein FAR1-RELATED SEQUENCE 5-like [Morus notabilis]
MCVTTRNQVSQIKRNVTDDVVVRCESMKRPGMKNVQIIDFIALELGGHDKLPFLENDIHNKLMRVRKAKDQHQNIMDSDGMIGYIRCLARNHGGDFYYIYNVDEENRLCNIVWSDGVSRRDYAVFGNVLAFDTTYRTNKYHKPLLLLVGVNNHWRTTVFGIALLVDETVDTFVWFLQMFLQGMNNRKPKVIVTDGDNAMKNGIAQIFSESKHRLCGWHLMENVANNVKDINFKRDFKEIMYGYYFEPEFLDRWHSLILAYELENNYWATCMFEKKESWVETYLRGNFCVGMRTTQRSESMNRTIRQLLDSTKSLTDFISLVDHAINKLRRKDLQDDFST